jgi:hypothetical protein
MVQVFVGGQLKGINMKNISSVIFLSFLIILLLVSNVNSSAPNRMTSDWVKYTTDNNGDVFSYKIVKIEKDGGNYIVQVWKKEVFSNEGREKEIQWLTKHGMPTEGYDKSSEQKDVTEIDCKKRTARTLSFKLYDTNGKVLYSRDYDEPVWDYIVPDSNDETILKGVCK